ncbi:MAG: RNA polymerase sigma factor [Limisphaerales bacterium]
MITLQRLQLEESDHSLIRRFTRQGDNEAFSILMARYVDMVCTTCRRILGDETQSADAVQETFFQLAKDAHRVTGSLGGWLHKVATRRAVDVIRQNASRRRREESYASAAMSGSSTWSEVEPAVDEALEALPETLREVLLLHFLQGRTTVQIAAAQGISQSTVSRRMNEALEMLRQILRDRGVQAGLVPLQAVLLHSNYIASEALRCGLGKIALAKATLSGAAMAASTPAGAGAIKLALAGAAVVLAAGTTWVAHKELGPGPAPVAAQSSVAASASAPAGSGPAQAGLESDPAQSQPPPFPRQPRVQPDTAAGSPSQVPRGFAFPVQETFVSGAPQVVLPSVVHTNMRNSRARMAWMTNAEESPLSALATNAPPAPAAAMAPLWLYGASGGAEVNAGSAGFRPPSGAQGMTPYARGFYDSAPVGPSPARSPTPFFLPNRASAQAQKK